MQNEGLAIRVAWASASLVDLIRSVGENRHGRERHRQSIQSGS